MANFCCKCAGLQYTVGVVATTMAGSAVVHGVHVKVASTPAPAAGAPAGTVVVRVGPSAAAAATAWGVYGASAGTTAGRRRCAPIGTGCAEAVEPGLKR